MHLEFNVEETTQLRENFLEFCKYLVKQIA